MEREKVVVGLSGGVDSSVAAHLLIEQGYEVIGMFMRNWHDESVTLSDDCPWIDDANDALLVANHLGIPFQVIDLSKEYFERIVEYMFKEYENGRTPNPDVLCNREIKFDVFLEAAMELGADYVATGHYVRSSENNDGSVNLLKGLDANKDQSYFLCQLNQEQLTRAIFPIGEFEKSEVREMAEQIGLPTAQKKDSQGLCFVGKVALPKFLQQKLQPKPGVVVEIPNDHPQLVQYHALPPTIENAKALSKPFDFLPEDGIAVAEHQGAHYYTVGQRKGLHIGGRPESSFVIKINTEQNVVYTGQTDQHPGLNRYALFIEEEDIHYVLPSHVLINGAVVDYEVQIRYRQQPQRARLIKKEEGLYILFDQPQRGIAPGQFAVWYRGDVLVGSGVIKH